MGAEQSTGTHTRADAATPPRHHGDGDGVGYSGDVTSPKQFVDYFATPVSTLCAAEHLSLKRVQEENPAHRQHYRPHCPMLIQDAAGVLRRPRKTSTAADLESPAEALHWAAQIRGNTQRVDLNHFVLKGDTAITPLRFTALVREFCFAQPEPLINSHAFIALTKSASCDDPLPIAFAEWGDMKKNMKNAAAIVKVIVESVADANLATQAIGAMFGHAVDASRDASVMLRAAVKNEAAARYMTPPTTPDTSGKVPVVTTPDTSGMPDYTTPNHLDVSPPAAARPIPDAATVPAAVQPQQPLDPFAAGDATPPKTSTATAAPVVVSPSQAATPQQQKVPKHDDPFAALAEDAAALSASKTPPSLPLTTGTPQPRGTLSTSLPFAEDSTPPKTAAQVAADAFFVQQLSAARRASSPVGSPTSGPRSGPASASASRRHSTAATLAGSVNLAASHQRVSFFGAGSPLAPPPQGAAAGAAGDLEKHSSNVSLSDVRRAASGQSLEGAGSLHGSIHGSGSFGAGSGSPGMPSSPAASFRRRQSYLATENRAASPKSTWEEPEAEFTDPVPEDVVADALGMDATGSPGAGGDGVMLGAVPQLARFGRKDKTSSDDEHSDDAESEEVSIVHDVNEISTTTLNRSTTQASPMAASGGVHRPSPQASLSVRTGSVSPSLAGAKAKAE